MHQKRVVVGVVVDMVGSWGRGILAGVGRYALLHHWELRMQEMWSFAPPQNWMDWPVDGFLVNAYSKELQRKLRRLRVPAVNLGNHFRQEGLPTVSVDNAAAGSMAARYFRDRKLQSFLYWGPNDATWSVQRGQGFCREVHAAGCVCAWYGMPAMSGSTPAEVIAAPGEWLRRAPKPVGVLLDHDASAPAAYALCREEGLTIPEQVAVVGINNEELICPLVSPQLSSIDLGSERVGAAAASLLDNLLGGRRARQSLLLPPVGLVERQSSDVIAVDDQHLAGLLRFIRINSHKNIGVDDVVAFAVLGRRTLERKFRAALGRSVGDEIRRSRIERAKLLLTDRSLSVKEVAFACGFSDATRFGIVFHADTGVTPGEYQQERVG